MRRWLVRVGSCAAAARPIVARCEEGESPATPPVLAPELEPPVDPKQLVADLLANRASDVRGAFLAAIDLDLAPPDLLDVVDAVLASGSTDVGAVELVAAQRSALAGASENEIRAILQRRTAALLDLRKNAPVQLLHAKVAAWEAEEAELQATLAKVRAEAKETEARALAAAKAEVEEDLQVQHAERKKAVETEAQKALDEAIAAAIRREEERHKEELVHVYLREVQALIATRARLKVELETLEIDSMRADRVESARRLTDALAVLEKRKVTAATLRPLSEWVASSMSPPEVCACASAALDALKAEISDAPVKSPSDLQIAFDEVRLSAERQILRLADTLSGRLGGVLLAALYIRPRAGDLPPRGGAVASQVAMVERAAAAVSRGDMTAAANALEQLPFAVDWTQDVRRAQRFGLALDVLRSVERCIS